MPAKPVRRKSAARAPRALHGTVFITRQVHFNAAHRLHNPAKSQKWNVAQYGLCTNPHWHGHNYVLEVSVTGEPDPVTGYVIDLGLVKRIVESEFVQHVDHRNLNLDVPFLAGTNPTSENIILACWRVLEPALRPGRLSRLRLWETENNYVEYDGR